MGRLRDGNLTPRCVRAQWPVFFSTALGLDLTGKGQRAVNRVVLLEISIRTVKERLSNCDGKGLTCAAWQHDQVRLSASFVRVTQEHLNFMLPRGRRAQFFCCGGVLGFETTIWGTNARA